MSMPATGDEEPADFSDAARDAGVAHYSMVTGIKQGVINMFAAGLFHAYEQQLFFFYREELLGNEEKDSKTQLNMERVKKLLLDKGIQITDFESWPVVQELRLVANTAKHAEGGSADQLRKVRPDLFEDPRRKEFGFQNWQSSTRTIYLPMMGEDLYVQLQDLFKYRTALVRFWIELGDVLPEG